MPNENTPLYGPGFTVSKDRFGNIVDGSASLTERHCVLGLGWRVDTGYVSLTDTQYASITFKTPATGRVYYNFASADKSGAEVVVSLFRAPTVSGGSAATPNNYFDDIDPATCAVTDIKTGATISGGTERFISLVPGSSNPSAKPGGSSALQGLLILRKNTVYAIKFLAKGGAVTMAANIGFSYVATAD